MYVHTCIIVYIIYIVYHYMFTHACYAYIYIYIYIYIVYYIHAYTCTHATYAGCVYTHAHTCIIQSIYALAHPVQDDSGFLLEQDTPHIDAEDAALMNGESAPASSSKGDSAQQMESFSSSASFKLLACMLHDPFRPSTRIDPQPL